MWQILKSDFLLALEPTRVGDPTPLQFLLLYAVITAAIAASISALLWLVGIPKSLWLESGIALIALIGMAVSLGRWLMSARRRAKSKAEAQQ